MVSRTRNTLYGVIILMVVLTAVVPVFGQREKVGVFVQAAVPVPAAQLDILKSYANQHCAIITGCGVASAGELMYAQRLTNTYIGNSVPLAGMRKLAQALDADHLIVFRIVRWESDISFSPERSLLFLGVSSFLGDSVKLLTSPLGLLLGLDKIATVGVFVTVFNPSGDIEFTTAVTAQDKPLFSLLTADPTEAAKKAIDAALYQLAVSL
ncbi:MAG TPA: hypothetical protein ENH11_02830 [Candidatus Acetothermia bacterium]|nr:hypothetical protein [Candidatus Acetothermia bacterium]